MKIKLGTQGKDGIPTKPGHTAVVVPQQTENPTPHGVIAEFKHRAATGLGVFHLVFGLLIMVIATVAHFKFGGRGCMGWSIFYAIPFIVTGSVGLAAARKKTRRLIIAFMVLAIIAVFFSLMPVGGAGKELINRHRHHHHQGPHHHGGHHPHHHGDDDDDNSRDKRESEPRSHDRDDLKGMDPMKLGRERHMMTAGHIVVLVLSILELAISIASCVIAGQVVGCCRKRQQHTGSLVDVKPIPPPAYAVDPTVPLELSPKMLAEQAWLKYQVPPIDHQSEMTEYEPDTKPQADKGKLASVEI